MNITESILEDDESISPTNENEFNTKRFGDHSINN